VAQYSVLQEGSTELFFYSFLVLKFNEHVTYLFFLFPCADEVFESIKILMPNLYRSLYWCLRWNFASRWAVAVFDRLFHDVTDCIKCHMIFEEPPHTHTHPQSMKGNNREKSVYIIAKCTPTGSPHFALKTTPCCKIGMYVQTFLESESGKIIYLLLFWNLRAGCPKLYLGRHGRWDSTHTHTHTHTHTRARAHTRTHAHTPQGPVVA
jgi:hypothetical protein